MNISLFCVFGLICLASSHLTNQESNPVIENDLEELELLLRQKLEQETRANGQNLYEEEKRKLEKERGIEEEEEEEEEDEENDIEKEEEEEEERKRKAVEEEELKEYIELKNDKVSSTSHRYRHLPSHSLRRKMEERKRNEGKSKNNVRSQKAEPEEREIDNPQNVDPDSPLEIFLEGMVIEKNGQQHQVKGLHPEKSAKTIGDTNDIHMLLPDQTRDLASGKGRKRNFKTNTNRLWHKNIIPYKMFNMSSNSITVINQAIQQFTDTTCVRWVPENTARSYGLNHQNVVHFINEQGCWSSVGNVGQYLIPRNVQKISLSEPDCISLTTSVHEMLHAIGAHHEQSRSDRDKYVEIAWANVDRGFSNTNMWERSTQDNNPYDAESAMQYAVYSYSINGQKTILFKDQRLEFLASSADGLEFYDIQDVNDAYHCADHCTNPPACENGGFVNFQCVCVCPDDLSGATCTDTVSNSPTCGGVVTLGQGEEKFIQSPNYPSNYPSGLECTWLIKGTTGSLVRATVEYMDIAAGPVCYHWLEYRYNLLGQKGPKRCGTNFNAGEEYWDSTSDELGNEMIIKFNSNKRRNIAGTRGFRLKLQSVGTGCEANPCVYGKCFSAEGTSTYTCTCNFGVSGQHCDVLSASATIGCSFEFREKCFLDNYNNDQFDWSYTNNETPTSDTGPSNAHGGYQFAYIETSSPRVQGDKAVLVNNAMTLTGGPRCLTFYYHMHGSNIGTLNVYTEGQNVAKLNVFAKSGKQGSNWLKGEVDVQAMNNLKIYFEGVRGNSFRGDIALDDIWLTPGTCASNRYTCDFEDGETCIFVDSTQDDFDWTRNTGITPSIFTGPDKAESGTYYMYTEVSSPRSNGDMARLTTFGTTLQPSTYCLSLSYHMKIQPGNLSIAAGESEQSATVVWHQSGHQGNGWLTASVDIPAFATPVINIEGTRGQSYFGDIAIDNLLLNKGSCNVPYG